MVVHELATNAVKYGALLNDTGYIEIGWRLHAGDSGPRFALSWIERDGPPVEQPQKQGFGSTVIGKMARLGLDAEISLVLSSAGLQWNLDCPEAKVLEPRALTPNEQSALPHDGMPRVRDRR